MSGHKVFRVYIAVSVKCARWAVGGGGVGGGWVDSYFSTIGN